MCIRSFSLSHSLGWTWLILPTSNKNQCWNFPFMVILTQRQQQKQLHKRNDDKENSKKIHIHVHTYAAYDTHTWTTIETDFQTRWTEMRWNWNVLYKSFSQDLVFWLWSIDTKHVYVCHSLGLSSYLTSFRSFFSLCDFPLDAKRKNVMPELLMLAYWELFLTAYTCRLNRRTHNQINRAHGSQQASGRARTRPRDKLPFVFDCWILQQCSTCWRALSLSLCPTPSMSFIDKFSFCLFRFRLFYI